MCGRWLRRARKLDELQEPAGDLPDRVGEAVEVGGLGDIGAGCGAGRLRSSTIRPGRGTSAKPPARRRNCMACSPSPTTCRRTGAPDCSNASVIMTTSPWSSSTSRTSTAFLPVPSSISGPPRARSPDRDHCNRSLSQEALASSPARQARPGLGGLLTGGRQLEDKRDAGTARAGERPHLVRGPPRYPKAVTERFRKRIKRGRGIRGCDQVAVVDLAVQCSRRPLRPAAAPSRRRGRSH